MLRFLSLASLSQAAIVATQLVLLPLQIHVWGHEVVALWFATLALAGILGVSDLGLRSAGFAALASGDGSREPFTTLWSVMRVHFGAATLAVLATVAIWLSPRTGSEGSAHLYVLAIAAAAEVFFGLRVTFMEARGLIARAEALFFAMAISRVVIGALLLSLFKAGPLALSFVWLVTALVVLLIQAAHRKLSDAAPVLKRWGFVDLRGAYESALWSVATPLVQWAQIQAPVIALSASAPPALVSSFVALRALFGLMRSIQLQLSRIASIQFGERARAFGEANALGLLLLLATGAGWLALGFSAALFAENFGVTGRLFNLPDDALMRSIALGLALSSVLSVHQIFTMSLARAGHFALTGSANYAYVVGVGLSCVGAVLTRDPLVLVMGLVFCDLLLLLLNCSLTMRHSGSKEMRHARMVFVAAMAGYLATTFVCWRYFMLRPTRTEIAEIAAAELLAFAIWLVVGGLLWTRMGDALRAYFSRAAAPGAP